MDDTNKNDSTIQIQQNNSSNKEPLPMSNYEHYLYFLLYFIGLVISAEIIIIIVKLIIHFYVI